LSAALESAHNVQEPAFCALTTARVNTLTAWWAASPFDLPALVRAFVDDPFAGRFSPRHRIGERFDRRTRDDHLPIGYISELRTHDEVAAALGIPRLAVARLNAEAEPEWVVLPPEFAPMVAVWLSALVAASDLPSVHRARLTATLVPSAAPDPTALDAVLGRLTASARRTRSWPTSHPCFPADRRPSRRAAGRQERPEVRA
jgi:hypothetical protein